jgi:uncharacterized protein DUF5678
MAQQLEEQLERLDRDTKWLHTNYNELLKKHEGRFVAIKDQNIVAEDSSRDEFERKLTQMGIGPTDVLIEFIRDKRNL